MSLRVAISVKKDGWGDYCDEVRYRFDLNPQKKDIKKALSAAVDSIIPLVEAFAGIKN